MLSSVGEFGGALNKIQVSGTSKTPDFSLDTANHPVPLETKFEAVVDGTSGDTYLNAVAARLGGTDFTAKGAVVNVKGQGHFIDLDVDVPHGRIEDFLALAVKDAAGGDDRSAEHEGSYSYCTRQAAGCPEAGVEGRIYHAAHSLHQPRHRGQGGHDEPAGAGRSQGGEARRDGPCIRR